MDNFYTIRFKQRAARRFKHFSKKVAKPYSETLNIMIDFFEWHGFLPSDKFERSIIKEIVKNRKRTEASIAIIRDIEKHQTKPTNAMLLSLFEEKLEQEEPELVEIKFANKTPEEERIEDFTVPKIRYKRLENKMELVKENFGYVLGKVKIVKSSFGKDYLKLELHQNEFIKIKRNLENL